LGAARDALYDKEGGDEKGEEEKQAEK